MLMFSTLQTEYSAAISKLLFLEGRRGNSARGGANLVSCGGNGIVRFWNATHSTLLAEFTAHQHGTVFWVVGLGVGWVGGAV